MTIKFTEIKWGMISYGVEGVGIINLYDTVRCDYRNYWEKALHENQAFNVHPSCYWLILE